MIFFHVWYNCLNPLVCFAIIHYNFICFSNMSFWHSFRVCGDVILLFSIFFYNNFAWGFSLSSFCCLFLWEFSFPKGNLVQRAHLTTQNNLFCCFCIVFKNMVACFQNIPMLCCVYISPPNSLSLCGALS